MKRRHASERGGPVRRRACRRVHSLPRSCVGARTVGDYTTPQVRRVHLHLQDVVGGSWAKVKNGRISGGVGEVHDPGECSDADGTSERRGDIRRNRRYLSMLKKNYPRNGVTVSVAEHCE